MELHEKIRTVRKIKGINQQALSKKLKITVQSYSMKETGKRPITTDELEAICEALEVSPSVFFESEFHVKWSKPNSA